MIVNLSLVSHTNAGKTTLARTLLRRDIGEVRDEAHVTEAAEAHTLLTAPEGEQLVLWDTPGFGDSVRLLKRLRQSSSPIGWMLTQLWDRFADRPFWSSQQAVHHVQQESDVVLYVANANEDPRVAAYVDAELQILDWIGKPAIVLLNQLGPPRAAELEQAEAAAWQGRLAGRGSVREVLAFDAFARCWVQEDALLAAIEPLVPAAKRSAFGRLRTAWRTRNLEIFEQSMRLLAQQLASAATDRETVAGHGLIDRARRWFAGLAAGTGASPDPGLERPMRALAGRLDASVRETTDALIALHGLSGHASREVLARFGTEYAVARVADAGRAGLIGAVASGALGGLAADLAAGGLSFGGGAVVGGVLGALGAGGLTHTYNLARGIQHSTVGWSVEFLCERTAAALLRYLAVAHFGRGRGGFVHGAIPTHWTQAVEAAIAAERTALQSALRGAASPAAAGSPAAIAATAALQPLVRQLGAATLGRLYAGTPLPQAPTVTATAATGAATGP